MRREKREAKEKKEDQQEKINEDIERRVRRLEEIAKFWKARSQSGGNSSSEIGAVGS